MAVDASTIAKHAPYSSPHVVQRTDSLGELDSQSGFKGRAVC